MTIREINLGDVGIITRMRIQLLDEVTEDPCRKDWTAVSITLF